MIKKPLVIGNWKMELSYKSSVEIALSIRKLLAGADIAGQVVVCPSFTALPEVTRVFENSHKMAIGAQNVHWEEKGAWTGEVSVTQIKQFAKWCIVGHSERRRLTGETDQEVRQKAELLLRHGITPIICIGETEEEKQQGNTIEKISNQMDVLVKGIHRSSLTGLVFAYEPIWAIGTGQMPDPDDISEVMLLIRKIITEKFDSSVAERLLLLYGGSVKPENAGMYAEQPGVDGVLVGGASVHPLQFAEIVKTVCESHV